MAEILIARFKNKREADAVTKLIEARRVTSRVLRGNNLEDMLMGELISESMKEKGSTPIKSFKKGLDAQIRALKR